MPFDAEAFKRKAAEGHARRQLELEAESPEVLADMYARGELSREQFESAVDGAVKREAGESSVRRVTREAREGSRVPPGAAGAPPRATLPGQRCATCGSVTRRVEELGQRLTWCPGCHSYLGAAPVAGQPPLARAARSGWNMRSLAQTRTATGKLTAACLTGSANAGGQRSPCGLRASRESGRKVASTANSERCLGLRRGWCRSDSAVSVGATCAAQRPLDRTLRSKEGRPAKRGPDRPPPSADARS